MDEQWYWFGILVDQAGHYKLRQYHIRQHAGDFIVESWSKGATGRLWTVRRIWQEGRNVFFTFEAAMARVEEEIAQWAAGYIVVDYGEPPTADYERARSMPSGVADPDWWAPILGVDPKADRSTVRAAYITLIRRYHPDSAHVSDETDVEKAQQVNAAWSFVQREKGW
jgi:hypothetical protein